MHFCTLYVKVEGVGIFTKTLTGRRILIAPQQVRRLNTSSTYLLDGSDFLKKKDNKHLHVQQAFARNHTMHLIHHTPSTSSNPHVFNISKPYISYVHFFHTSTTSSILMLFQTSTYTYTPTPQPQQSQVDLIHLHPTPTSSTIPTHT